jgi:hypothetical protein
VRARSIERVVIISFLARSVTSCSHPALRWLRAQDLNAHAVVVVNEALRSLVRLTGLADVVASLDAADAAGLFGGDTLPEWLGGRPTVYSWLGASDDELRARVVAAATQARFFRVERGASETHTAVAYARAVGRASSPSSLASAARIALPQASSPGSVPTRRHPGAGTGQRWTLRDSSGRRWWRQTGGTVVRSPGPRRPIGAVARRRDGARPRSRPLPRSVGARHALPGATVA